MDSGNLLKEEIESRLRNYWQKRNEAYLDGLEFDRAESMFGPTAVAVILNQNNASPSYPSPSNNVSLNDASNDLPESVLESVAYYDRACPEGARAVFQLPFKDASFWIVSTGTGLDDGWIEVFDAHGNFLSAGRRYVELVSWGTKEELRALTKTLGFPAELNDRRTKTIWKSRR